MFINLSENWQIMITTHAIFDHLGMKTFFRFVRNISKYIIEILMKKNFVARMTFLIFQISFINLSSGWVSV